MKLVQEFDRFLSNHVNMNQNRIEILNQRVSTICDLIRASDEFRDCFVSASPQGSYAQKTIIKPGMKRPVFDADIVILLKQKNGWKAQDYINGIYGLFKNINTYENKVSRQTRCVKLDYTGEFHIDVVPCVLTQGLIWREPKICNKASNKFEPYNSIELSEWLNYKNKITPNSNLLKVIRLSKFIRDHKQTFSVKSILLSILLGSRVSGVAHFFDVHDYSDVPSTLKSLFNSLNRWLQRQEKMPLVLNPVDSNENFNRHWNEDKFQNFKMQMLKHNELINSAFDANNKEKSLLYWKEIFGPNFGC